MNKQARATLLFAGDIYPGDTTAHVCQDIQAIASNADLVIVNLEAPLTENGTPLDQKPVHLKTTPANIQILKELSTDVVSLANNHICDWGFKGLTNTRKILTANNIATVGAGNNRDEAEAPLIIELNGLRIGIIAFGAEEIQTFPAQDLSFGCAILDNQRVLATVAELSNQANVVVVEVHWGYTNYHYPLPEHILLGRSLIDAGAKLVVAHHPHVIQGYERYGKGAIIYSLGNLCFIDYLGKDKPILLSKENRIGMLAEVNISMNSVESINFHHTSQVNMLGKIVMIRGRGASIRERFLTEISKPLSRSDYSKFFRWYTLQRIVWRAVRWLNPYDWKRISKGHLVSLYLAIRRIMCP